MVRYASGPQPHPSFIEVSCEAPVGGGDGEVEGAEAIGPLKDWVDPSHSARCQINVALENHPRCFSLMPRSSGISSNDSSGQSDERSCGRT